jgi:two-component system sensor histidine kinase DesK
VSLITRLREQNSVRLAGTTFAELNLEGRRKGMNRWRGFAGVFLIYLVYALIDLFQRNSPLVIVVGLLMLAAFVYLYLYALPLGMYGGNPILARNVPILMSMITVLYLITCGPGGLILVTYLCISFVLLWRPVVAVPLVLAMCAATIFLPQYVDAWDIQGQLWGAGGPALLVSIAMIAVRINSAQQIELFRARHEVEQLAADQERHRIGRDLHDLLGHALTAVVVKADLAAKLAPIDSDRAAAEMRDVAELARQGLADVRAVISGFREVSLLGELATAREVLRAAGIEAELPASDENVLSQFRELFGWVVREGVTNVVRHSRAEHVRVCLGERSIEVVDDGRGAGTGPASGTGLRGLSERVAAAGGELRIDRPDRGGWRLSVEVRA